MSNLLFNNENFKSSEEDTEGTELSEFLDAERLVGFVYCIIAFVWSILDYNRDDREDYH